MRFFSDAVLALLSRLVPRLASASLFVILIRQTGESMAGTYSLAVAFLASGVLLTSFGLEELIVREVAKDPSLSRRYWVNMLLLRSLVALMGYGIITGIVTLLLDYELGVRRIILIQCLGLLPEGLIATTFAVFNANRKLNWMASVSVCVSTYQLTGGALALWMGAPLESLIWILLAGSLIGVVISSFLCIRFLTTGGFSAPGERHGCRRLAAWRPDWEFCRQQMRQTLPFALLIALVGLDLQLGVVLLSSLKDVAEVGVYSAAQAVILMLSLAPQAFRMTVYPSMAAAYATSETRLRALYRQSWRFLSLVGLPMAVGSMIVSRRVIDLVYGDLGVTAARSLGILTVHLLVSFFYIPSTRLMVVSNRQKQLSVLLGVSLGINLLVNLLLTNSLGAIGTSIARVISSMIYLLFAESYVYRNILPGNNGIHQAVKPLLAVVVMAPFVWLLRTESLLISVPIGAAVYCAATLTTGAVTPSEREAVMASLRSWLAHVGVRAGH